MKKYVVVGLCFLALVACKDETFHQLLDTTKFHESNQTTVFVGKWKQVLKTDDKGVWISSMSTRNFNLEILDDGQQLDSEGFIDCGSRGNFELNGQIYSVEPQVRVQINPACAYSLGVSANITFSLPVKDTLVETRTYSILTAKIKYIRVN
ncbi:MAG: hypothetical protein QE277_00755 [Flectobacillus sp.]|nr:hypothetical protein [Flectobacillus sp.]